MNSKGGRPTRLTPEVKDRILGAIKSGNDVDVAYAFAGVSRQTWYNWGKYAAKRIDPYYAFACEVEQAMAQGEVVNVHRLYKAGEVDWRAAVAWLERARSSRWAKKIDVTNTVQVKQAPQIDYSKMSDEALDALEILRQEQIRLARDVIDELPSHDGNDGGDAGSLPGSSIPGVQEGPGSDES
jgi:hypothetical protein